MFQGFIKLDVIMQGVVSIKGANLQMKSEFEQEHYLDIRL